MSGTNGVSLLQKPKVVTLSEFMEPTSTSIFPLDMPRETHFFPLDGFRNPCKVTEIQQYEVFIRESAWRDMVAYTMEAPKEVSGFGIVNRDGNSFTVNNVFIFEQNNTIVRTKINWQVLFKFMKEQRERGLSTELMDCWWHSHVNGTARFSQQDLDQMEAFECDERYLISIVMNKRLDAHARIDFYKPQRFGIDGIPIKMLPDHNDEQMARVRSEMALRVRNK